MTDNGLIGAKRVRYVPESGVALLVEPLSPFTLKAISLQAHEVHPDPDEEAYRLPFPESAIEGDTKPATENPEYVRLANEARIKRADFIVEQVLLLACEPENRSRADLIEQFALRRSTLNNSFPLPEDEWMATLLHCICTGRQDPNNIHEIAAGRAELTEVEVRDGIAFFELRTGASPLRTGSASTRSITKAQKPATAES